MQRSLAQYQIPQRPSSAFTLIFVARGRIDVMEPLNYLRWLQRLNALSVLASQSDTGTSSAPRIQSCVTRKPNGPKDGPERTSARQDRRDGPKLEDASRAPNRTFVAGCFLFSHIMEAFTLSHHFYSYLNWRPTSEGEQR